VVAHGIRRRDAFDPQRVGEDPRLEPLDGLLEDALDLMKVEARDGLPASGERP